MEQKTKRKLYVYLPWVLILVVLGQSRYMAIYERFMNLTGEVLKLSRMNTNIKSADLSLGKLRLLSSQCREILANLQETVRAQGNYSLPLLKKGKEGIE